MPVNQKVQSNQTQSTNNFASYRNRQQGLQQSKAHNGNSLFKRQPQNQSAPPKTPYSGNRTYNDSNGGQENGHVLTSQSNWQGSSSTPKSFSGNNSWVRETSLVDIFRNGRDGSDPRTEASKALPSGENTPGAQVKPKNLFNSPVSLNESKAFSVQREANTRVQNPTGIDRKDSDPVPEEGCPFLPTPQNLDDHIVILEERKVVPSVSKGRFSVKNHAMHGRPSASTHAVRGGFFSQGQVVQNDDDEQAEAVESVQTGLKSKGWSELFQRKDEEQVVDSPSIGMNAYLQVLGSAQRSSKAAKSATQTTLKEIRRNPNAFDSHNVSDPSLMTRVSQSSGRLLIGLEEFNKIKTQLNTSRSNTTSVDPLALRFSQWSVGSSFSNGSPISEMVNQILKQGDQKITPVRIGVVYNEPDTQGISISYRPISTRSKARVICFDNRRLLAHQIAASMVNKGHKSCSSVRISVQLLDEQGVQRQIDEGKMDLSGIRINGGMIAVRRGPGLDSLRISELQTVKFYDDNYPLEEFFTWVNPNYVRDINERLVTVHNEVPVVVQQGKRTASSSRQ